MSYTTFRRRNFFIKKKYQSRFALVPILFFSLFQLGGGAYLYWYLKGFLEFQMYLPHSRLQNPWDEISPVLTWVAVWGGGLFLLLLAGWVWRRFGVLRRDLNRLADWMSAHVCGQGAIGPARMRDKEVSILAERLDSAVGHFGRWQTRLGNTASPLADVTALWEQSTTENIPVPAALLADTRRLLASLETVAREIRVDESLR